VPRVTITIRDLFWVMFVVGFSLWSLRYRREILADKESCCDQARQAIAEAEEAEKKALAAAAKSDAAMRHHEQFVRKWNATFERLEQEARAMSAAPRTSSR
jgi:hypothetical protein